MESVGQLLQIHGILGGKGPGRRWGTEVLNKSAVVLLLACWEAYLEDVAAHAFDSMLKHCTKPAQLPKEVIKRVGHSLREVKDERAIWRLAGDGWKTALSEYVDTAIQKFHNPNSVSVDDLFLRILGMENMSQCWHWTGMSSTRAKTKLDRIVTIRGSIAHRVKHTSPVHLNRVRDFRKHVRKLVRSTDRAILNELEIS
jgi:hypothetical protein